MNRSVTALLILATVSFATGTAASAKDTVAVKRPSILRQIIKPSFFRRDEVKADTAEPRMIIREESAVVVRDQYAVPEGALYTSSDECG